MIWNRILNMLSFAAPIWTRNRVISCSRDVVMSCYVVLCYVVLCRVMSCYVMFCRVMLWHVTLDTLFVKKLLRNNIIMYEFTALSCSVMCNLSHISYRIHTLLITTHPHTHPSHTPLPPPPHTHPHTPLTHLLLVSLYDNSIFLLMAVLLRYFWWMFRILVIDCFVHVQ